MPKTSPESGLMEALDYSRLAVAQDRVPKSGRHPRDGVVASSCSRDSSPAPPSVPLRPARTSLRGADARGGRLAVRVPGIRPAPELAHGVGFRRLPALAILDPNRGTP